MSFPHRMVNRIAWAVTAVAAVLYVMKERRESQQEEMENELRAVMEAAGAAEGFDWSSIVSGARERIERTRFPDGNVIVAVRGVRNNAAEVEGFRLTKPANVRVYAVGEGLDGIMYDHGWILDASTYRPVWQMRYDHTDHAGGADKNRVADEVVRLEPGNYIVQYVTDGSHAYGGWNNEAPADEEAWGIQVVATDRAAAEITEPFEESANPNLLARLVQIGDDEHRRASFELDEETLVHVTAMGEGSGNTMYDYAWIEVRRTGERVWSMEYADTHHAGGGDKNRMVETALRLPAGEYVVYYESDGSHSFNDWNTDPPANPFLWGVTVTCASAMESNHDR